MTSSNRTFLPHLEGLRGLAILLVVCYHITNNGIFKCGYFGVDVFLVIAGYLFFSQIRYLREQGRFKLFNYWGRRLLRIFPPMLPVIAVAVLLAIKLLPPANALSTADLGMSAQTGWSNIYQDIFLSGYFDEAEKRNPLLHLWYLSVMLQAYILLPLMVLVSAKAPAKLRAVGWGVVVFFSLLLQYHTVIPGLSVSLCNNEFLNVLSPAASPYLWTSARLWELLAGGTIVCMPEITVPRKRTICALIGLLLILVPAIAFPRESQVTIPAVIGSMMMIRYADSGWVSRILVNPVFTQLGRVSFSLYLWHWPICSMWKYVNLIMDGKSHGHDKFGMFALSLALAYASCYLIEKRKFKAWAVALMWVVVAAFCAVVHGTDGMRFLTPPELQTIDEITYDDTRVCSRPELLRDYDWEALPPIKGFYLDPKVPYAQKNKTPFVWMGDESNTPGFVLMGDSHANSIFPAFDKLAREHHQSGIFLRTYSLPFTNLCFHQREPGYESGEARYRAIIKWLRAHPELKTVFIGQYWRSRSSAEWIQWDGQILPPERREAQFTQSLRDFCTTVHQELGRELYLLMPAPIVPTPPQRTVRGALITGGVPDPAMISMSYAHYLEVNAVPIKALEQMQAEGLATVVHSEKSLFPDGKTFCAYEHGQILSLDSDHLTKWGAFKAMEGMKDVILKAMEKSK